MSATLNQLNAKNVSLGKNCVDMGMKLKSNIDTDISSLREEFVEDNSRHEESIEAVTQDLNKHVAAFAHKATVQKDNITRCQANITLLKQDMSDLQTAFDKITALKDMEVANLKSQTKLMKARLIDIERDVQGC